MAKISAIKPALKKITGKPMGVASKMLGAATVASVIYDAHVNGAENALLYDEVETGKRCLNQYHHCETSDTKSATINKFKKIWYETQQNFPFHAGYKIKGYVGGFGQTIINNIPLLALSAVALKFKNAGKIAGGLLAVNGIKTLLYDVVGIGKDKLFDK
ncbi:MAG: hypothetical protein LUH05_02405 [Candidatus Gastranaerophilales bacterium]|nr:hypothetical protein [Candidatus Gastranaerophilales bacterium]